MAGLCPFRLWPVASAVVAVAGVPAGMPMWEPELLVPELEPVSLAPEWCLWEWEWGWIAAMPAPVPAAAPVGAAEWVPVWLPEVRPEWVPAWEPVPGMWVPEGMPEVMPEWVPEAMWVSCRPEVMPVVVATEELPEDMPVGRAPVFSPANGMQLFRQ